MPIRHPSRRTLLSGSGAAAVAGIATLFMVSGVMTASAQTAPNAAALFEAVERNDAAAVADLLAKGVAIDARNAEGETALLVATHQDRVEIARLLILAGADVNAKDRIQDSPYLYAGARGHLEILKLALAHGADLGSTNRYGGTALIPASERGHVETVRTLIEAGVAVDHVNNLGWTALLEAILLGDGGERHVAIVGLLLDGGADASLPDGNGVTPLRYARERGFQPIVELLTKAGARG